ncbi:MAG: Metallo-beta-lactamase superfamily protein [Verrucomicrobia bacterium ADurb.Bin345]|nr:MAG: Metallo-beta-lactamase superfamily protein [Verrucomicrobia bacterium ADurb.Bin345]
MSGSERLLENAEAVISVLVENTAARNGLEAEHGLSFWIQTPRARVLFDTGQGAAFSHNVAALGIPLEEAEAFVLSHGHYDHTGGLAHALDRNKAARVFLHPGATIARYSKHADGTVHSIGMPKPVRNALDAAAGRIAWTRGPVEVAAGMWATGSIPRETAFEDTGGDFFLDAQAREPDLIPDDQALWFETSKGIVVVLGCAHSGVVNTLNHIAALTGVRDFHAVIGGMHLRRASAARLAATVEALEGFHVSAVHPAHCTGGDAVRYMTERMGVRVKSCSAGVRIAI